MEQQQQHDEKKPMDPQEPEQPHGASTEEFMFESYGDKYATRASEEGFGVRFNGGHRVNPFDKNVKGELAEELGIPELKNREQASKRAEVSKETPGKETAEK